MPPLLSPRFVRGLQGAVVTVVVAMAARSVCFAQSVSASALKAAYTLNFIKFTEWPDLKPGAPTRVCVAGEAGLAGAMTKTLRGVVVSGHTVDVVSIAPGGAIGDCQVLFLGGREPRALDSVLAEAISHHVLTVSDTEHAATHGAVIELFMDGDRLRFAINTGAMERCGIKISSRLLSLAQIVRKSDAR